MAKCTECVHYGVCKVLIGEQKIRIADIACSFAEKCVAYKHKENFVEVVRCKDCEYAKPYDRGDGLTGYYCQHPNSTFLYGANWERIFEPVRESNDFCSHGKKKEA